MLSYKTHKKQTQKTTLKIMPTNYSISLLPLPTRANLCAAIKKHNTRKILFRFICAHCTAAHSAYAVTERAAPSLLIIVQVHVVALDG